MTKEEIMKDFGNKLALTLGEKYELNWDIDKKGVVCGWCKLSNADDICKVAVLVAGYKGRVMTISPLIPTVIDKTGQIEINYHFYFDGINCTASIVLPSGLKKVNSITTILKSADWHEREMRELYNMEIQGHPNPKKLFLDESIHMTDKTMIPLSEAMNGASTNTLWEKIMKSGNGEVHKDE